LLFQWILVYLFFPWFPNLPYNQQKTSLDAIWHE
jgi:hypothetical protein